VNFTIVKDDSSNIYFLKIIKYLLCISGILLSSPVALDGVDGAAGK
jgi:hypothetical protein